MKLVTAAEMRRLDQAAIEQYGIPGLVLMENAGRGTFRLMEESFGPVRGKLVPVFVGPGNNGGDGLVIARWVHETGGVPLVVHLTDPANLTGDALTNFNTAAESCIESRTVLDQESLINVFKEISSLSATAPIYSIVDALFGTGLKRPLKGLMLKAVRAINTFSAHMAVPVTAVDIPSGLDSDTGRVLGECVKADLTATYGFAKPGHFMHGGGDLVGKLHVVDISIPAEAVAREDLKGSALDSDVMKALGSRSASSHKGSYGHLLVMAGSTGKSGAALLAALGALRSGSGLVTMCAPGDLTLIFESAIAEAMTSPLPGSSSCFSVADYALIQDLLQGKSAVVLGPGLGNAPETMELVARVYRETPLPVVVDADALNLLALQPDMLANPSGIRILTPHPGEMSRLTGLRTNDIQDDRLGVSLEMLKSVNTASANVTLVLKGAGTVICDPNGTWSINTTGNPGMAAGGMGDVLAGMLGGFLAQGIQAPEAARLAVYLHGLAADRLGCSTPFGYLASEVADMVPLLIGEHLLSLQSSNDKETTS